MRQLTWVGGVLVTIALAAGCGRSAAKIENGETQSQVDTSAAKPAEQVRSQAGQKRPISAAEAATVAEVLQAAADAHDERAFANQFDFAALVDLTLADSDDSSREARELRKGFEKGLLSGSSQLVKLIFTQIDNGGSYQYLRTLERPEGARPLFRLRTPEGALNYHEIILDRRPRGIRIVDFFVYASGERISETMERMMMTALPPETQTLWGRISGSAKSALRRAAPLNDMVEAHKAGNYPRALEIFDSLPPELRADKGVQLIRVMSAQHVEAEVYRQAMDEYVAAFPNDPSMDLMSVDAHLMAGRFQEAHESIDRLDRKVGGDPYLQFMRGNLFLQEGKHDEANRQAEQILRSDERDLDAHWLLVAISLEKKEFQDTAKLLTKIRDELGMPLGDLRQLPDYADFVASPEFEAWQAAGPK